MTKLKEYSKSDKPSAFLPPAPLPYPPPPSPSLSLSTSIGSLYRGGRPRLRKNTHHRGRALGLTAPVVAVWIVVKEEEERKRKAALRAGKAQQREAEAQREEMRREAGLGSKKRARERPVGGHHDGAFGPRGLTTVPLLSGKLSVPGFPRISFQREMYQNQYPFNP